MDKELYSSIEIERIAGGADKDGEYAWVILKEEVFDAPEGGNKLYEREIELIRKDLCNKEFPGKDFPGPSYQTEGWG